MKEGDNTLLDEFYDKCKNGEYVEDIISDVSNAYDDQKILSYDSYENILNIYLWGYAE